MNAIFLPYSLTSKFCYRNNTRLVNKNRNESKILIMAAIVHLNSQSNPPAIFDGTTRLYISTICPYAQRVWIARNFKVPALEHNNKVIGESLDLLQYLDDHFEGPKLFPEGPVKQKAASELLKYIDTLITIGFPVLSKDGFSVSEIQQEFGPVLDHLEDSLGKFADEGPFFLGQFGVVDIAYVPFIERFQTFFSSLRNFDITTSRPKLAKWVEEMDKIDAYAKTRLPPEINLEAYKWRVAKTRAVGSTTN
ncbi:glutathione S-transferase L3 isoform X2 [Cryptomeria japonica]|uniref:glutathione S-transferase L3 isoform X2 n=1 Tax=Cryptomeria japonica TaxID=3369 RepID=UPI0027DA0572|nr:glutathione S-transferase L3 isoform X2 [Cryptomeria japonica]